MNRLQIEAYLKIVEMGNLTKAANALFVSQSTLSDRLSKLESELGVTLFNRGPGIKGAEITDKGKGFLDYAMRYQSVLSDLEDWKHRNYRNQLSVSGPHSVNAFLLPKFYSKYVDSSELKLNVSSHWNHTIYNMLDTYELDIGIVSRPYSSRNTKNIEMFKERLLVAYNSDYSDYSNIKSFSDLRKSDEIHLDWGPDYEIWYQKYWSINEVPKITVDSAELIAEFLKTPNSWAVMPLCIFNFMKEKYPKLKEICCEEKFYRKVYLVFQRDRKERTNHFINDLKEFLNELERDKLIIVSK